MNQDLMQKTSDTREWVYKVSKALIITALNDHMQTSRAKTFCVLCLLKSFLCSSQKTILSLFP
jgi:hypothetical protein